jgi:hypothetical protein
MTNAKRPKPSSRAFWLRQLHQWHWISAALSLIGMLLFTVTGITLNHAGRIESKPDVHAREKRLPAELLGLVSTRPDVRNAPLPAPVAAWIEGRLAINLSGRDGEWSGAEIYVSLPRPGGDAWVSIDTATGDVKYERTDRGWIAFLNDLHKGRHTGALWSLFIDLFAAACLIFCVTGLLLMKMHARTRPATWPTVALGFVIPLLIVLFVIHQ